MSASLITTNEQTGEKTAKLTGEKGEITIKPNSLSTISVTIPANTDVTAPKEWDGKINPPLIQSSKVISTSGEDIKNSTSKLTRDKLVILVKTGNSSPLTFSNPVTLNIPVNSKDGTQVVILFSNDGNNWETLGEATAQGGNVSVLTNHMTYFAVSTDLSLLQEAEAISAVFNDITSHWAKSYIEKIADKGIVSGKSGKVFAPDTAITRAELTKIAVNAFGLSTPTVTSSRFFDVDSNAWYAKYVEAAANAGWVQGYSMEEGVAFSPNAAINRAEALKLLLEAAGVNASGTSDFSDISASAWFAKYVGYAAKAGIVSGYGNGSFGPGIQMTRAEAAKIIAKILGL
ncbi:S-layer homology domain-containing protein [bacterium]|nr:S-layer homology domain-containing protein [bacterium]